MQRRAVHRESLLVLIEHVSKVALATVLAVEVLGHEDASATVLMRALATHASDLVGAVDLVVLEHMKLDLLLGVLDLLRLSVGLLLALLTASAKTQDEVQSRLLLDVVVLEGAAVLELLSSEDETLLIRGDALLILDLSLDGLDGVSALNLEGDGLARECLHKDLHGEVSEGCALSSLPC